MLPAGPVTGQNFTKKTAMVKSTKLNDRSIKKLYMSRLEKYFKI